MKTLRTALLFLPWLVVVSADVAAKKPEHTFSVTSLGDMEALQPILQSHVAHIEVVPRVEKGDPLSSELRDGYGAALDPQHLVTLSFLVAEASRIRVDGPNGKTTTARVVLADEERRVAILRTDLPVSALGLEPVALAPKPTLKMGEDVFVLTTTGSGAGVLHGVLTYIGEDEEYGGHHRTDLILTNGMPVFDARARLVGYARTVGWDRDRSMLVTPEMITESRTATAAKGSARERASSKPRDAGKPWWSR